MNPIHKIGSTDFVISSTNANKNMLFLGSCRLFSFIKYVQKLQLFDNYNLYFIYVPDLKLDLLNFKRIYKIISKTDLIACEYISNFKYLNTVKSKPYNIYKNFDIPKTCKIAYIANLENYMYYLDLLNSFDGDMFKNRNCSLNRLKSKLYKNDEHNILQLLSDFLFDQKFPLFYTHNHPSCILSFLSFKNLLQKLNVNISNNLLLKAFDSNDLYGNNTLITYWDKRIYNVKFCDTFFEMYTTLDTEYHLPSQYNLNLNLQKQFSEKYL